MRKTLRGAIRLAGFVTIVLLALLDFLLLVKCAGKAAQPLERAIWLHRWSKRTLRLLSVRTCYDGEPPPRGLLISNHLSYLDILVFSAAKPMVFVSKSDVLNWPIVGWLTRCGGTLYIRRDQRSDVARLNREIEWTIRSGVVVAIFPEGTSSDGSTVLPFHSSLLAPAEEGQWPCTSARITYKLDNGTAGQEICYWGEMTFAPHLLNLMTKEKIDSHVVFSGPAESGGMTRKELARRLHQKILALGTARESASLSRLKPTNAVS